MPMLRLFLALLAFVAVAGHCVTARAVEAVQVAGDSEAVDLGGSLDYDGGLQDRISVSTAPGPDGILRRIEVRSVDGSNSYWAVLALTNPSDEQIDRLLVAPFFRLVGSGVVSPDLGSSRIAAITPSQGIAPDRLPSRDADVFRVTLDPGAVVTYVLELKSPNLPELTLWQPDAYRDSVNAYSLYKGIVLGIAGLLALFLTIVFVVKGTVMFPATAALAWAVLGYVMIDFYFLDDVLQISVSEDRIYRAAAEVLLAVALVVFLYGYLNLARWHVRYRHAAAALVVLLVALFGVALAEPRVAAGIARIALAVIGGLGLVLVGVLAVKGSDRAVMLIPTWLLLCAWLAGAAMAASGMIANDIVQPALAGGLVLIVLLIGFTVLQHAFAGGSVVGPVSEMERSALALIGSGDPIWDWDVDRDHIHTSRSIERRLGLAQGALQSAAVDWLDVLHPQDGDRFRHVLDAIIDRRRGRISEVLRIRAEDGHYRWLHLRARPIIGADGAVIRCIGTLVDVTDDKVAEERLLHDAVRDYLTGLPNRDLCLDRLDGALARAALDGAARPYVVAVGLDGFHAVNEAHGPSVGDSVLLTVARRLQRLLSGLDTLARTGGDRFTFIVLSETEAARMIALADEIRRQIRAPIAFGDQELVLTASVGVAAVEPGARAAGEVMHDAELAMTHAKRLGGDRTAAFTPVLRRLAGELASLESDLGRAIGAGEIRLDHIPIRRFTDASIAGFEVVARWDHPRRGRIDPATTAELAERAGVVRELAQFTIERSVALLAEWQELAEGGQPLALWISLPLSGLLTQELVEDVRAALSRVEISDHSVWIGVTESAVLENPERAGIVLKRLNELGAGLALDDVGTDWSAIGVLSRMAFDVVRVKTARLRTGDAATRKVALETVASLSRGLGTRFLVSGVDEDEILDELAALGCDFGQGKLFGGALGVDAVRRLVGRPLAATGT